jgi:hypothetical protein
MLAAAMVAADAWAHGGELLPPDRPIEAVVDEYLEAKLRQAGVEPASGTDDAGFVRRLTLDLVGRVPTATEWKAYVEASDPGKRTELVDRLMASPGYVRHQADEFDALMMGGTRGSLRDYLVRAFGENRPWDRIFREIVLADETDAAKKGSSEFLKQRVKDLDRLTNDVSTTFFGVNVSCAKCHDHPRVPDWKQDHFYGMKSFFARTFDNGGFLGERGYGVVKFQTTKGQERRAKPMFLTGRVVEISGPEDPPKDQQRKERKELEEAKKKKVPPPPPAFSMRSQLLEVSLRPGEREFFSRAIVNRLWNRFFGTGLVMPLDQMHSENPPSHPELLDWLARDLIAHDYDLRRLTRGFVLSRAYARSSQWRDATPPDARLFAMAAVRPLSPVQLARSMWVATADPGSLSAMNGDDLDRKVAGWEGAARDLAQAIARPGEDYQIGVSEALLMSNSDRTAPLLAEGGDRLIGKLTQIKDPQERATLAVRTIFSRPPADDEISILADYLDRRSDRPSEASRQLVWTLVTSAEFRFNY